MYAIKEMKPGQSCVICPQADALLLWWHTWAMVLVRDAIMTLEAGRTVFCTIVQYFVVDYIFGHLPVLFHKIEI